MSPVSLRPRSANRPLTDHRCRDPDGHRACQKGGRRTRGVLERRSKMKWPIAVVCMAACAVVVAAACSANSRGISVRLLDEGLARQFRGGGPCSESFYCCNKFGCPACNKCVYLPQLRKYARWFTQVTNCWCDNSIFITKTCDDYSGPGSLCRQGGWLYAGYWDCVFDSSGTPTSLTCYWNLCGSGAGDSLCSGITPAMCP